MKRYLIGLIIVLFLFVSASADHRAVVARKNAGVSPDCSEDFNTGDTGDVETNTEFDYESDSGDKLDILNTEMRYYASNSGTNAYARENTCINAETEVTVKFTLEFDDIIDVDNTNDNLHIIHLFDSGNRIGHIQVGTNVGGDVDFYLCCRTVAAGDCSDPVTMTGLAADTSYDAYIYYIESATVGEVACKIGDWAEANTGGNDDTSADTGLASVRIGGNYSEWGDGTTDTYVIYDNFEVYFSDQMP